MHCTICNIENSWLSCIGSDNVCAKCITKHTIFKELRFSDEKRLAKVLRRRSIPNFEALKAIDEKEFEKINVEPDSHIIKKYKEKKKASDDIPIT